MLSLYFYFDVIGSEVERNLLCVNKLCEYKENAENILSRADCVGCFRNFGWKIAYVNHFKCIVKNILFNQGRRNLIEKVN